MADQGERIEAALSRAQTVCRHEQLIDQGPNRGRCWWCGARPVGAIVPSSEQTRRREANVQAALLRNARRAAPG